MVNAFFCNKDFSLKTEPLGIGSILFICIEPHKDHQDIIIDDVVSFHLQKIGQIKVHHVLKSKKPLNPLTVVVGKKSRKCIIGTRLPAVFFDSDHATIFGIGTVDILRGDEIISSIMKVGIESTDALANLLIQKHVEEMNPDRTRVDHLNPFNRNSEFSSAETNDLNVTFVASM